MQKGKERFATGRATAPKSLSSPVCVCFCILFFFSLISRDWSFISSAVTLLLKAYACSTLGVMKHCCASEHSCAFLMEKEAFYFENIP